MKIDQIKWLKECFTGRNNIDDTKCKGCDKSFRMFAPKELLENRLTFHSDCYKSVTNKTNIQRLKKIMRNVEVYIKDWKIVALKLTIL